MRSGPEETKQLFSYVDIEERISEELSREFAKLYSHTGRPSILNRPGIAGGLLV